GNRPARLVVRACLDLTRSPARPDRHRPQSAEQDGLAHAAQAGEHQAPFRTPARDAFEDDVEGVELAFAPCELGRALTGSGGERVPHGIHGLARYWFL